MINSSGDDREPSEVTGVFGGKVVYSKIWVACVSRHVIVEAIVFIGLPASGKSTFFQTYFFHSHVRVSLDLLGTRYRESKLIDFCLQTGQPFAIDNTNPSVEARRDYLSTCRSMGFTVRGFYFQSVIKDCLNRNRKRSAPIQVPEVASPSKSHELEIPVLSEGFDSLNYVRMDAEGFEVQEWCDEV